MSFKLLRETIRAILIEAAVPVASAAQKGYALYIQKTGKGARFVLYNPTHYAEFLKENSPANLTDDPSGVVAYFETMNGPQDSCAGAAEVSVSSAQKGLGPMMYDICMSYVGLIMPDRSNVTPAAANIWAYYAKRSDVEKVQLDDNDCKTFDDGNLNFAYKMKAPVNYGQLVSAHEAFVASLDPQVSSGFVQNLPAVGVAFFDTMY